MSLTPAQLEELRSRLLAERARIKGGDEAVMAMIRQTELEVGDEMDAAEASRNQGDAAIRSQQDRALLAEVERALNKMKEGTYGISELTDEPIGYARLSAVPWARYSVREQEDLEREMAARRVM